MPDDLRLIEDYLPIEAISKEASREKSVRKGHISTLHLWWARRPLVACRAAVYGALVPADRWVRDVELKDGPSDAAKAEKVKNGKKKGLNRKAAKDFVTKLCRYPKTNPTKPADIKLKRETEAAIVEAQRHILEAHADRLTVELVGARDTGTAPAWVEEFKFKGDKVFYDDIVVGRAPRPRVLDMFAGGGAIPLEALRLGCEAHALDLNPVAHIIQLCTLVYPQKYGKPDPAARGMTGPKDAQGATTWGGLAAEVRYWGNWVLERVRKEIGDLYPLIPDPDYKPGKENADASSKGASGKQIKIQADDDEDGEDEFAAANVPPGYLMPVAYLWTRTVRCKNPACGATVPLVRQTWLCKKAGRFVALKPMLEEPKRRVLFAVVEAHSEAGIGFDPAAFSQAGDSICPFCGTVADNEYIKLQGCHSGLPIQHMATIAVRAGQQGKVYLTPAESGAAIPSDKTLNDCINKLLADRGMSVPAERVPSLDSFTCKTHLYGLSQWGQLFTPRQNVALLEFCSSVRNSRDALAEKYADEERAHVVQVYLGLMVSRTANFGSSLCLWNYTGGRGVVHSFSHQAVPITWDFPESNPLYPDAAGWCASINAVCDVVSNLPHAFPAIALRGDARNPESFGKQFDAIVTDPPYYDNISYANLSDFFFVWLKRAIGSIFTEHLSAEGAPKKNEIIAESSRHNDNRDVSKKWFEENLRASFAAAANVLKPAGSFVCVYAHKTTLGWATLVDAMRRSRLIVTEAWPLATERPGGMKVDRAMLASSIFLVARKREANTAVGNYEDDVQPELQQIVRERVETLWEMGIAGADLVIACVGAGLRAFTKYEKVEYANGEEVPAQKFLAEVEGVVLDTMMGKLSGVVGANVAAVDNASRFYVLWRFVYKTAELDAGEAIVFSNGTHIELDGPSGLSAGKDALVEKKKAKYRLRDYTERGSDEKLGLPTENGQLAPLIDALHRILWLMDHSPRKLSEFLDEARPDRERLRVLAQALAGAALSGKSDEDAAKLVATTPAEQSALGKLLANWRSLIEEGAAAAVVGKRAAKEDKQAEQRVLPFGRN